MGIPASRHVQMVRQYVQAHLSERIAVSDVAREQGVNACYLIACFRAQTDRSLAEICAMLGYFDQSHFSRAIRTTFSFCRPASAPRRRRPTA